MYRCIDAVASLRGCKVAQKPPTGLCPPAGTAISSTPLISRYSRSTRQKEANSGHRPSAGSRIPLACGLGNGRASAPTLLASTRRWRSK